MSTLLITCLALLATPTAPWQEPRFPASSALAEGVSPEALGDLDQLVQSFVDDGDVVGAELLVIVNGHSILHEAYGLGDQEAGAPLEVGSLFCVRSMTKPLIGTAILMLVDDNVLELDDPLAKHLPEFDVEASREITVEQLLTHTSGLPMSMISRADLAQLEGVRTVALRGAGHELDFPPGSAFQYSDQGTDTLTALIEAVAGMGADEFVATRILEPLGMTDSTCVLTEEHRLRELALPLYAGSRGDWTRFWGPDEPPLFPFFLGSQGLYSTLADYARFTDLWLHKGRAGRERLLGSRYVRAALEPGPHPMPGATAFPGLTTEYGYLMQLYLDAPGELGAERELVAFGHSGSDGTHAWVFPAQKAMAFYFTQSRGNTTGLRVEEALGGLFLGAPFDPNQVAPPFEQYLGYYFEGGDDLYRAVVRDGDDLALEIMGQGVVALTYLGEDRWKFRDNPSIVLDFDRGESGAVTGYHIGAHQELRFEPGPELPSAAEISAQVQAAHRLDLLETLGPARLQSSLTIAAAGIEGRITTLLAWPDRFRYDSVAGENTERLAFDGERLTYAATGKPAAVMEPDRAALMRIDQPLARLGDWARWHDTLEVIQRIERDDREVVLVRTGDCSAPATTYYVDTETGRVLRQEGLVHVDLAGRIGQRVSFGDFREVSGMTLPYRTAVEFKALGGLELVTLLEAVELGVALDEGAFDLLE